MKAFRRTGLGIALVVGAIVALAVAGGAPTAFPF